MKNFTPHSANGKFHLLTIGQSADLKPIIRKELDISTDFAMKKGEHYEKRIPIRIWAEDDLPSE